jgi:hypothetical protein
MEEEPSPDHRPRRAVAMRPALVLGAAAFAGVVLVAAGWVLQGAGYVPGLLLQVGSSLVLLVPLLLLGRLLERRVQRTEEHTEAIVSGLGEVQAQVNATARRIDALSDVTRERIRDEREADEAGLRAAEADPTYERVLALLQRARDLQAISPDGLRVRIGGSGRHVRFGSQETAGDPQAPPSVRVVIEDEDGRPLRRLHWYRGEPVEAMTHRVAQHLHQLAGDPGDLTFEASELLQQLLRSVRLAVETHNGARPRDLGPLVEVVNDQWAITDDGLSAPDHGYSIARDRLLGTGEDWIAYMARKPWVNSRQFQQAYRIALRLYRSHQGEDG